MKRGRKERILSWTLCSTEGLDVTGAFGVHHPCSHCLRASAEACESCPESCFSLNRNTVLLSLQGATLHVKRALVRVPCPALPATPAWSCPTRACAPRAAPWATTGMPGRPADVSTSPQPPLPSSVPLPTCLCLFLLPGKKKGFQVPKNAMRVDRGDELPQEQSLQQG